MILDCLDLVELTQGGDNLCEITINEIIEKKPDVTFILGRSCVGKTTLARHLEKAGFSIISLDKLMSETPDLSDKIREIYADEANEKMMSLFYEKVIDKIKTPIVIEGAIKKISIVQNILNKLKPKSQMVVYIEPDSEQEIAKRYEKRLNQQLGGDNSNPPAGSHLTPELIEEYKTSGTTGPKIKEEIKRYSKETMEISKHRKEYLSGSSIPIYVIKASIIPPATGEKSPI